jgi:nucleoside-diphosphate-sugar epimerase
VCFSTTAAIGIPKVRLIDENTPLHPVSPYGQSKKEADEVISLFIKKHQLPIVTLCFPHIYGPGEQRDFLKIMRMIKKGIFPQVGFSPNLYPSIFVTDAVDAICLAMTRGKIGEKYIIADDDPHDLRAIRRLVLRYIRSKKKIYPFMPKYLGILGAHLVESVFELFGAAPPITAKSIRSITAGRRLCIEKARKDMGFEPKVDIEEGIRRTVNWAQKEHLL